MTNYNIDFDEFQARHNENFQPRRRSSVTAIQTLTFCPECNKRITTGDELYICELEVFCSEECGIKFETESEA